MTCPNGFLYILCDNCDKGQPIFVYIIDVCICI